MENVDFDHFARGRIRDDVLKPFISRMDASKLLRPVPLSRRALSGAIFVALTTFLSLFTRPYAYVAAARILDALDLTDALALKSLRAIARIAALEKVAHDAPFLARLAMELVDPLSVSVILPLIFELLLMLIVGLFAEQLAKSLTGIIVVQHFDPNFRRLHAHHDTNDSDILDLPAARIIPAWRRQLALYSRAPFAVIDWLRLLLGAQYRWADLRLSGHFELCVPLDDWPHPFMRRALRRLYNDAHSGRIMPKSGRVRSIVAGVVVAAIIAGSPSHHMAMSARTNGGAPLAFHQTLGADIAPGERVRSLTALVDTYEFVREIVPYGERAPSLRRQDGSTAPRKYMSALGRTLELDVDQKLWKRTGLWYGAELLTPFGSACVVGIDAHDVLWVAHDVHILSRSPVPLLSYGVFESVSALSHFQLHVMEDPALLGAAAAGAAATKPKAVATSGNNVQVQLEGSDLDMNSAVTKLMQDAFNRIRDGESIDSVLKDLTDENENVQVVTLGADGNVQRYASGEEDTNSKGATAVDDDDDESDSATEDDNERPRVYLEVE